ncbi:MAG: DUF6377 domain-containing protein [Dysgonomonas sp.]
MKYFSLLFALLIMVSHNIYANEIESLFEKLNESFSKHQFYIEKKENRLSDLKQRLKDTIPNDGKYLLSKQIMEEYSYYISDSALFYSQKCLDLSEKIGCRDYLLEIKLKRAYLLCFPELFHESFKILESIDPESLSPREKADYYNTYILVYHNQIMDLNNSYYRRIYKLEIEKYLNLYFSLGEQDAYQYLTILAYKYYLEKDFEGITEVTNELLNKPPISAYSQVELLYNLGAAYAVSGGQYDAEAKKFLIMAAIEGNELAIMKNPPLLYLAMILINEKDTDKAYRYINIAFEQADMFSNNHRQSMAKRIHYSIQHAYLNKIESQQGTLQKYLIIVTGLCICIGIVFIYVLRQNKVLKKTRLELSEANTNLRESNHVKETYITYYLNQYSAYIDKLNEYNTFILRKLNAGQHQELIKSEANFVVKAKKEIDALFESFDKSFLDLYPNFIDEMNALLTKENNLEVKMDRKKGPKLNAEIRILALIRLGVTDNKMIASFLRFTVQTVYNYRSKLKAKAINEDTFEEDIRKINH